MQEFTKLFEPGRIGSLEVKNRIIFPPMITLYKTEEGGVSDRLIDHYAERAKGGAGLVVTEASYPRAGGYPGRIYLNDDKFIPGLRRLTEAVHREGAKIVCEINPHRGRADEHDPASASPVPHPFTGVVPRQLGISDIKNFVESFGEGVRRAKEAGYDGVMIHGASGYLVSEFLSPLINKRTDEYGGDIKGRGKFALELVEVTRKIAGLHYPVIFRVMADEKVPGGFGVKDAIALCKMLQEAGVDAIDVTSGSQDTPDWAQPTTYWPPGCNGDLAGAIKRELRIPVSVVGKINDPYVAEEILKKGQADFVDMGRTLVADPYLPRKAMEGRVSDIRKCIACQKCSETTILQHVPLVCAINPSAGREREFETKLRPAKKKKKVLVIGGGPGGMEAAMIAAQKGHSVTLWEANAKLGGQLNLASIPPGKADLDSLVQYLKAQLAKLKVKVELGKKATVATIGAFHPEAVVVAVGSAPFIPDIPGVGGKNVFSSRDVLSKGRVPGEKVVVIGEGFIACEMADFLAEKGKKVVLALTEAAPMTLEVIDRSIQKVLLDRLGAEKVNIVVGIKQLREIIPQGIKVIDKGGNEILLEADSIVFAAGSRSDKTLAQSLKGKVSELYEVGDCVEARRIGEAIHEGAEAALQI
jgi:2,4-dienoyl-CoA reductase-like NADH-dependent reductase (Old Yellow Enzyme family)/thioredoxin reductase